MVTNITNGHVSVAVDLSRLNLDTIAETALKSILNVGREVDLLETIRRTEKDALVPLDFVRVQASHLSIPGELFELKTKVEYETKRMMTQIDEKNVKFHYQNSSDVYNYGLKRLQEIKDTNELNLLDILSKSLVKPSSLNDFYSVLSEFPKHFRQGLNNFIINNNVLIPFNWKQEGYLINHRLYKDEKKFGMAMDILQDKHLENVVEFLQNNPGNPLPVVSKTFGTQDDDLYQLSRYGIIEPIRLNVQGDEKDYLFSPTSTLSRVDKDHFDLVKTTLANFRFGEYYSCKTRLWGLDRFLTKLLDTGYAGSVEAIGTDYVNIENKVVKVQSIGNERFRFWLLKKDVIQDVREIVRGYIPIQSSKSVGNITDINNLVQTRRQINVNGLNSQKIVNDALREINEGACC